MSADTFHHDIMFISEMASQNPFNQDVKSVKIGRSAYADGQSIVVGNRIVLTWRGISPYLGDLLDISPLSGGNNDNRPNFSNELLIRLAARAFALILDDARSIYLIETCACGNITCREWQKGGMERFYSSRLRNCAPRHVKKLALQNGYTI